MANFFSKIINDLFRCIVSLKKFARSFFCILLPKIRILEQYSPRPLIIPKTYLTVPTIMTSKALLSISLVTPSYNQREFIQRTIQSVLNQEYPKLEYIVQDGDSKDGSFEAIKSFGHRLTYFESRRDNGQAHAINLGFQRTNGEIMAYLNSDDILLPGALWYVADYFARHPDVDVVYSHRVIINEKDEEIGRWVLPPHDSDVVLWADYIPQETLFWRRSLWEKVSGQMDESFYFALDWDLIIRFHMTGAKFVRVPRFLAAFRAHVAQKTSIHINETGLVEMNRLRKQIHKRDISNQEITKNIMPYFLRSLVYHMLYRLGVIHY